jgi:hypothetical protein
VVQLGCLTIQENNKILQITIEDNGKGFDTSTFYILEGFGINQIKARIKALGTFKINSQINLEQLLFLMCNQLSAKELRPLFHLNNFHILYFVAINYKSKHRRTCENTFSCRSRFICNKLCFYQTSLSGYANARK